MLVVSAGGRLTPSGGIPECLLRRVNRRRGRVRLRRASQSGRYSRSPVAGLYQTRICLPEAGSMKTSSVG
jgi:hypothetical protein